MYPVLYSIADCQEIVMLLGVVNTNRRSRGLGIELVGRLLLLILAISGLCEVVLGIGVVVATTCGTACGPEGVQKLRMYVAEVWEGFCFDFINRTCCLCVIEIKL